MVNGNTRRRVEKEKERKREKGKGKSGQETEKTLKGGCRAAKTKRQDAESKPDEHVALDG